MRAYCLIRPQPVYRREAFVAGLEAAGCRVECRAPAEPRAGDVLVIWNRFTETHALACRVESAGGTVIVAENGYLDPGRHVDRRWYALALDGHNGQGRWPDGGPGRWAEIAPRLGARVQPWRTSGEHVLVCPNRSFGRPGFIQPDDWGARTVQALRKITGRPVRLRPHPGNDAPRVPLADDLAGAWAVVVWASSAGVHALLAGVPVASIAPRWICKPAALESLPAIGELEHWGPWEIAGATATRQRALERMAWAQWEVEEIAAGAPFRQLLSAARQGQEPRAA